jgi:hypothetical protein
MKKFTGLLFLTAALLIALPTPRAGAVAPPAGPFFICVNTTAKPPLPNARVVTSAASCMPFEYVVDLNPPVTIPVGVVCASSSVGADGGFNQQATCPTGQVVLSGGFACTDSVTQGLLNVTVEENTFAFSGVTPMGWQTIGVNNSADAGTCEVCVSCANGACKDPNVCAP